jgi:hypothetical protein
MWDGAFCGVIGFRWQPGTTDLPPYCLGHIGFSVVPWKRRRGYATRALAQLLPDVRNEGLTHVELTTDVDNVASQRVILANGGQLIERFQKLEAYGGATSLRFRIPVAQHQSGPGMREVEVYGRRFLVERTTAGWRTYFPGDDGKRRPVPGVLIPAFVVSDDELLQYLADQWHESARPDQRVVRWIR